MSRGHQNVATTARKPIHFDVDLNTPPHHFKAKSKYNSSGESTKNGEVADQQDGHVSGATLTDLPEESAAKQVKLCETITSVAHSNQPQQESSTHIVEKYGHQHDEMKSAYENVGNVGDDKYDDSSSESYFDEPHKLTATDNCDHQPRENVQIDDRDGKRRKMSDNVEIEDTATVSTSETLRTELFYKVPYTNYART